MSLKKKEMLADVEHDGDVSIESGGSLDIESGASFKIAGTAVTSTAAEMNLVGGLAAGATFVIGTEAANAITVSVQLVDGAGTNEVLTTTLWCYLSDDSGGVGLTATAPTGGIAGGTDGTVLAEPVDNKLLLVESEADGDIDLVLTDTGTPTFYLVMILPTGRKAVSGAITFA